MVHVTHCVDGERGGSATLCVLATWRSLKLEPQASLLPLWRSSLTKKTNIRISESKKLIKWPRLCHCFHYSTHILINCVCFSGVTMLLCLLAAAGADISVYSMFLSLTISPLNMVCIRRTVPERLFLLIWTLNLDHLVTDKHSIRVSELRQDVKQ